MTARTKKIMNAPENIISEMIEGMVGAHPDLLRVEGATGRAIDRCVRTEAQEHLKSAPSWGL